MITWTKALLSLCAIVSVTQALFSFSKPEQKVKLAEEEHFNACQKTPYCNRFTEAQTVEKNIYIIDPASVQIGEGGIKSSLHLSTNGHSVAESLELELVFY